MQNPSVTIQLTDGSPQQVRLSWLSPRKPDAELRAWAESLVPRLLGTWRRRAAQTLARFSTRSPRPRFTGQETPPRRISTTAHTTAASAETAPPM